MSSGVNNPSDRELFVRSLCEVSAIALELVLLNERAKPFLSILARDAELQEKVARLSLVLDDTVPMMLTLMTEANKKMDPALKGLFNANH